MEYTQERITTLHRLESQPLGSVAFEETGGGVDLEVTGGGVDLEKAIQQTAVVVPMVDREYKSDAAEGVLSALETLTPAPKRVIVAVRAEADQIEAFRTWLESFELPLCVLWCNAPAVEQAMADAGLSNGFGKGRDVWLALGIAAAQAEYVVVHDADATSYEAAHVTHLLTPLAMGYAFAKGYYARVEDGQLYGRLCRLCYEPLVQTLEATHDEAILSYLGAFRYALAGEFAMTAALARRVRPPRTWGLEIGTLGDAFAYAGFEGTAQVDLGVHRHDHRDVAGPDGLEGMSRAVVGTLLNVIEAGGVTIEYDTLQSRYLAAADRLVDQYHADAIFNGLTYDPVAERAQIERYATALTPPGPDRRLPPWTDTGLEPATILEAATVDAGTHLASAQD